MNNDKQGGGEPFGDQVRTQGSGEKPPYSSSHGQTGHGSAASAGSSQRNDAAERGSFDAMRADLAKLTDMVSQLASKQVAGAGGQVKDAMASASDTLSQAASDARDQFVSLEADLEDRIKRQPLVAVGVALVAGLILGKLAS